MNSVVGRGCTLKINSDRSFEVPSTRTACSRPGFGERSNGTCCTASAGVIHRRCGQQPWDGVGQTGPVATSNNAVCRGRRRRRVWQSRGPPERVEAEVAALKEKVAALEGELKGARRSTCSRRCGVQMTGILAPQ